MKRYKLKESCYTLGLFLTIVAFSIALTINFKPLYYYFVDQEQLYRLAGMSRYELLAQYGKLLNYLNFPWIGRLQLKFAMSQNGMGHFVDCKKLFLFDYVVLLATLPFAVKYVYNLAKQARFWTLINPIRWLFSLIFVLTVLMIANFNAFFVVFHKILFRNANWLFDPVTDPIINVLPEEFFMACFVFCLIIIIVLCLILYGLGQKELHQKNSSR